MKDYIDITSENPIEQIWKLLRNFQNPQYTSRIIRTIHNLSDDKQKRNVTKQAEQIGYCIRQGQEYFQASSQVGLPTRPLLLYYGVMSLSSALILLRQTGDYSLDALRRDRKHQHHGLELNRELAQQVGRGTGVEDFLTKLVCNCYIRNGEPCGQFTLLCRSIIPCTYAVKVERREANKRGFLRTNELEQCSDIRCMDSLITETINVLDLIRYLPDMYSEMNHAGIKSYLCRGHCERFETLRYIKKEDDEGRSAKFTLDDKYFFDGVTENDKEKLISCLKSYNPDIEVVSDFGNNLYLSYTLEYLPEDDKLFYVPDAVNAINGDLFYILKPESYLHEPISYFIILFCLGMLSRYYPDVWVRVIDKDVDISEFVDSLLNVAYRKFPNLILNQMTQTKYHMHI